MEALLCLFLLGGIVSESTTVRGSVKRACLPGQLCEVQGCSLAKMIRRAEVGSRLGFGSRVPGVSDGFSCLAALLWSRRRRGVSRRRR